MRRRLEKIALKKRKIGVVSVLFFFFFFLLMTLNQKSYSFFPLSKICCCRKQKSRIQSSEYYFIASNWTLHQQNDRPEKELISLLRLLEGKEETKRRKGRGGDVKKGSIFPEFPLKNERGSS